MPSLQDSAVIFILALLLFGPKKLPELARQLGKLMGEFRRASNEFRMQMEDELRVSEQAEKQKQITAMEAAAPAPALIASDTNTIAAPTLPPADETTPEFPDDPYDVHPHLRPPDRYTAAETSEPVVAAPLPIATSGDLSLMPPATGLPVARSAVSPPDSSSLSPMFDAIPQAPERSSNALPGRESSLHPPHITPATVAADEAMTHG